VGLLGALTGRHGGLQGPAVLLDFAEDASFFDPYPLGLSLELDGVSTSRDLRLDGSIADSFCSQAAGAPQSLSEPRETEPGLLSACQRGQVLAQSSLQGGLDLTSSSDVGFDLGTALDQNRLVGELLLQ
jgi:hypothetical protein